MSPCTDVNKLMVTMGAKDLGDKRGIGKPTRAQVKSMRKLYWDQAFASYQGRSSEQKAPSTAIIKYDAANAFGTPIRATEVCTFGPRGGDKFDPTSMMCLLTMMQSSSEASCSSRSSSRADFQASMKGPRIASRRLTSSFPRKRESR